MSLQRKQIFLASGSPRRHEMVADLGLQVEARGFDVDESTMGGEAPLEYVARVTRRKLDAGLGFVAASEHEFECVIAADTAVVLGATIFGKPKDAGEALGFLERLCGRSHQVMSSYAVGIHGQDRIVQRTIVTEVSFRDAETEELERYVKTGEGRDKAGAYAIQGVGAFLVRKINGSYSNVVGLPLCELVLDLKELGILNDYPQS